MYYNQPSKICFINSYFLAASVLFRIIIRVFLFWNVKLASLEILLQQEGTEVRKCQNIVTIPYVSSGQLNPILNIRIAFTCNQCS